jgi:uncharacterized membrane protein
MEHIKKKTNDTLDRISYKATRWVGSTSSLVVHTAFFVISFILYFYGININTILLVLTTIVSLEAIYLAIFIQMSVNRQSQRLRAVSRDVGEIQEDVDEIQKDIDEIQEDVDEIQEDVDEIQEDVDEIEKKEDQEIKRNWPTKNEEMLLKIEDSLGKLAQEIIELKKINAPTPKKKIKKSKK